MTLMPDAALALELLVGSLQARIHAVTMRAIGSGAGRVALLDFPNHPNVGDSAIWLGAVAFLRGQGLDIVYACDPRKYDPTKLSSLIGDGPILLNGGGNFGDIWSSYQKFRHAVLQDFPDNAIIRLPQSIHFGSVDGVAATRELIERHGNFKLFVRDPKSLAFAREQLAASNPEMCPDMAFMLGRLRAPVPVDRDVLFLKRTDKERCTEWDAAVARAAKAADICIVDWLDEPRFTASLSGLGVCRRLFNLSPRTHGTLEAAWLALANRLAARRLQRRHEHSRAQPRRDYRPLARPYPVDAARTVQCRARQQLRQDQQLHRGLDQGFSGEPEGVRPCRGDGAGRGAGSREARLRVGTAACVT